MKKALSIAIVLTFSVILGFGQASAVSYTLTLAQIDAFYQLQEGRNGVVPGPAAGGDLGFDSVSSYTITPSTAFNDPFTAFLVTFQAQIINDAYALFGLDGGLGWDLTGYDTFELAITNTNESTWDFTVGLVDNLGKYSESALTSLLVNETSALAADLNAAGFNKANVRSVFVRVQGDIPNINNALGVNDRQAEFHVAPIPEPATVLLLGLGLIGAAAVRRKVS